MIKLIKAYANIEFYNDDIDHISVCKKIEEIARLCYKSENNITVNSWKRMINNLRDRRHWAMLEHHNIVLSLPGWLGRQVMSSSYMHLQCEDLQRSLRYLNHSYLREGSDMRHIISGSPTAFANIWEIAAKDVHNAKCILNLCKFVNERYPMLIDTPLKIIQSELDWVNMDDVMILSNEKIRSLPYPSRRMHEMVTAKFVVDRGVSHEIVRHRPASYAQESTRYCNYGKRDEVQFVIPNWFSDKVSSVLLSDFGPDKVYNDTKEHWTSMCMNDREALWFASMSIAAQSYLKLLKKSNMSEAWTPEQARSVLPNSLKTELYMSATLQEWEWFFKMRVDKAAHPQMREVAIPLLEQFVDKIGWNFNSIKDILLGGMKDE